jgi:hypothetical protein
VRSGQAWTAVAAVLVAAVVGLAGCGYDTNNQNSPNSTHVGTETEYNSTP